MEMENGGQTTISRTARVPAADNEVLGASMWSGKTGSLLMRHLKTMNL
jgi:hypothetical protein